MGLADIHADRELGTISGRRIEAFVLQVPCLGSTL